MKLFIASMLGMIILVDSIFAAPQGKAFNHFLQIWFENQDFDVISNTTGFTDLLQHGILLNNFNAITHPSQPNYIAAAAGSTLGVLTDSNYNIPASVKTIFDLIENKGLSWKLYQENIPFPGYTGRVATGKYVRKHNPAISFDSIRLNFTRAQNIVDERQFQADVESGNLPNWMFYTPSLLNDGHNTGAAYAGSFLSRFYNYTLSNPNLLDSTVVLITFDENANVLRRNRVWSLLIGAIPQHLKGTTDDTFYTHYSSLSTVEHNWDLDNLAQQDANVTVSNVFQFAAEALNYTNIKVPLSSISRANFPIFGPLS